MLTDSSNHRETIAEVTEDKSHGLLFLLPSQFWDNGQGPYFCPQCAEIVGLLEYFPILKNYISIRVVEFSRPRSEMVSLLGKANQNCPLLILQSVPQNLPGHLRVKEANGYSFLEGPKEVAEYLAHVHGTPLPH